MVGGARGGGTVRWQQERRERTVPRDMPPPPRATMLRETRDCGGTAGQEPACGGPVWGSAAVLAFRLSRLLGMVMGPVRQGILPRRLEHNWCIGGRGRKIFFNFFCV